MKNISFKRNESVLRGTEMREDQKKKKRPRNWDRIVYFVLLFIVLFLTGRYFFNKWFYIEADGHVLFDNVDIRIIDDSRILKYCIEEGDEVQLGDTLFTYTPEEDDNDQLIVSGAYEAITKKEGDVSWSEKEVFTVNEEIKLNQLMISEKEKMKTIYERDLERIRNEVMLDVLPPGALEEREAKINQLSYDIQTLNGKNNLLQASLGQLYRMKRNLSSVSTRKGSGNGNGGKTGPYVFYSPLDGTITRISKNAFEVALRDEVILSIHRPDNVYIKGFFKQEDLQGLKKNDIVTLEFPDGTTGKGIIKRFYFTTYRLPEEFQKKYEPTTRSLSADILPASKEDLRKWRAYWKLGVKIRKFKY